MREVVWKRVTAVVTFLALAAAAQVFAAPQPQPAPMTAAGLWQAVDDSTGQPTGWFLISEHDGVYAGSIAKMYLRPGESPNVTCDDCKDDRKGKPWLGLEIIRGMKPKGAKYEDGTILDPRNGRVYSASMTLSDDGQTLTVRGYFGISLLGKNQYWKRLPDTAYDELDPSINPKRQAPAPAPAPRKSGAAPKPDKH